MKRDILRHIIAYTPPQQIWKYCSQLANWLRQYFSKLSLPISLPNRCLYIPLNAQIIYVNWSQSYHCLYISDDKILLSMKKSSRCVVFNCIIAYTPSHQFSNYCSQLTNCPNSSSQPYHILYTFAPDFKILFSINKLSNKVAHNFIIAYTTSH